nr:hypothetical protein [Tanacetum cinerariifolium]
MVIGFKGLRGVTAAQKLKLVTDEFTAVVNTAYAQLVLLVYKVTAVFNKVNAVKSRVTTTVRVSTAGWIKWIEDQDIEYDLWLMRIEQYFLMTDYSIWKVIKNGNKLLKKIVGIVKQIYEPTFVEEKLDRKNEMKARGTLLMALPNKDQLKFHSYQNAKLLMEAIKKRLQKLISQLEIQGNYIPPKPDLIFIDEQVENESVDVISKVSSSAVKIVESKVESVDVKNKEFKPKVKDKTIRLSIEKIKLVKPASVKVEKGNPQQKEYKEKGFIDSGCSRHITGNKCYLTDYEDYDGGFVSFRDDETVYKEWEDIIERAATTASSLEVEQDSVLKLLLGMNSLALWIKPKRKPRQEAEVHSPSSEIPVEECILTPSNYPLPSGVDSIQLNVLMIFSTILQQQVLDLEEAKTAQANEIAKLKKRVKKLEKKRRSRPAGLKRLKKDIDQDVEIALVNKAQGRMHDAYMFGVDDLEGNEVNIDVREKIVEKEVSTADPVTTVGEVVTAASVEDSAAPTTATTTDVDDELTLVNTLISIKAAKPKVISTATTIVTTAITTLRAKGIVFHEQVQAHIPTVPSSKDKGKAKMIEPKKPLKKKDQIAVDKEVVRKLEAKMKAEIEEEEMIAREKDKLKKENNYPLKKDLNFWPSLFNLRERQELEQESAKKQKLVKQEQALVADDDTVELKRCLEIFPEDDDDVAIKATTLFSKSPTIVDYKIYIERKKSYFKIIRADGNS